jgi:hypothetical protein
MKFTPKSEKEIAEANLWPAGEYGFEVIDAKDKVSKTSQAEMIELKLKVYNDDGGFIFVNDYLLESLAYKLRHAAVCCGLEANYDAGNLLANDFAGKMGKLKLKIQKDKSGLYPDKNTVGDYVTTADVSVSIISPNGTAIADDTIPFN